jgi:hypothetical protein
MIAPLLSLLASLLVLSPLDPTPTSNTASPTPADFGSMLQQLASEFSAGASQLLLAIDRTVIDVTRVAYVTVFVLGIFLYFTHIHKRLGKELITGGIVLAVLSEFVFPVIVKV